MWNNLERARFLASGFCWCLVKNSWSSNFEISKKIVAISKLTRRTGKQKSRNKSPFIRHGSLLGHLVRRMICEEWMSGSLLFLILLTVDCWLSIIHQSHPSQSQPILCIVIIIRDQLNPYLLHIYEHNISEEKHLCAVSSWNLGKQTGRFWPTNDFKQNKSIYLFPCIDWNPRTFGRFWWMRSYSETLQNPSRQRRSMLMWENFSAVFIGICSMELESPQSISWMIHCRRWIIHHITQAERAHLRTPISLILDRCLPEKSTNSIVTAKVTAKAQTKASSWKYQRSKIWRTLVQCFPWEPKLGMYFY